MQTSITSSANEKIKYVRSLARREVRYAERRFLIEGAKLTDEAQRAGVIPALVLYEPAFAERPDGQALLGRLWAAGVPCDSVAPRLLEQIADTVTPQGLVAVVPFPGLRAPERPSLVLVADGISTPGNLGTLLRSAEAAGVGLVILTRGSTDPFAPKVVRGGMGVHFRLPIMGEQDWPAVRTRLADMAVYVAEADAAQAYFAVDWRQPAALIVGSEAHGPSPEAHQAATAHVAIPMAGQTESLNAGVAGSVILFEAARQRRLGTAGGCHIAQPGV